MLGMDPDRPAGADADPDRRTLRRRRGDRAEALVARHLAACSWTILATQLRIGRDEIDILALEPGRPPTIVVVEVRGRAVDRFGAQEERLDGGKVRRLYRATAALRAAGRLPDGRRLPAGRWRVDLVAVDLAGAGRLEGEERLVGRPAGAHLRHLRGVIPP
jgi:putative endonuclease